ncbi:hypothetical protein FPOAC1_010930 [Fusarium poae]|uniref:hypothetical protein n=1 Tax=Fusarium poae TaxID=36050 RepID=UPI001CE80182|nr:hypothetical protein FPOAC1_010930 [Fusarium poae]KAG8666127.1 hypothetical protein FPOAC1_010930 [Fusarium poae]
MYANYSPESHSNTKFAYWSKLLRTFGQIQFHYAAQAYPSQMLAASPQMVYLKFAGRQPSLHYTEDSSLRINMPRSDIRAQDWPSLGQLD